MTTRVRGSEHSSTRLAQWRATQSGEAIRMPDGPPVRSSICNLKVRHFCWGAVFLLGLQFAALLVWSAILFSRHALTWDYSVYHQAWYLIAHGRLDPFDTAMGKRFWHNDTELILWPLALLYYPWPHGVTLLWVQDIGIVASEAIALRWLAELLRRPKIAAQFRPGLALWLALILLVANPWVYWTASFDFHLESLTALFLLLTARALYNGHHRLTVIWSACTIACGLPGALALVGVGLGGLILGKRRRLLSAGLAIVGLGWIAAISAVGGGGGANLEVAYGYLATGSAARVPLSTGQLVKGVLLHPGRLIHAWWRQRSDAWAMLAPTGAVGALYGWAVGVSALVLASSDLYGGGTGRPLFVSSAFQHFPLFPFATIGTVLVLAWLARRFSRRFALALAGLVVAQAIGWAIVWIPAVPTNWLRVSRRAAAVVTRAQRLIPKEDEVVVSQGVAGAFSGRRWAYPILQLPITVPVHSKAIYFVIAPYQGIESAPVAGEVGALAQLVSQERAAPVLWGAGVWVLQWKPPLLAKSLTIHGQETVEPGWAFESRTGAASISGPSPGWHMAGGGRPGYVEYGAYWREGVGLYRVGVSLATSSAVTVEVRDATGSVLLARRQVPSTDGLREITIPFMVPREYPPELFTGWGPFRLYRPPPPRGDRIEVRVWSAGHAIVNVYSIEMTQVGGSTKKVKGT